MKVIVCLMNLILFFPVVSVADELLSRGGVFELDSGEWKGVDFAMYKIDSGGWAFFFDSNNGKKLDELYMLAIDGSKGNQDVILTFDFEPGLDCNYEFDLKLDYRHEPIKLDYGFYININGSPKWNSIDFERLMVYFDDHEVNTSRCD